MIEAANLWPTAARSAMRIDQRLRIDLEMALGKQVHVSRRCGLKDPLSRPEEDSATLLRMGISRLFQQDIDHRA